LTTAAAALAAPAPRSVRARIAEALLTPLRALRWRYVPLLMVYFSYGALGIIAQAQNFWVKNSLTLTPSEIAAIAVWLNVPWTIKMVFGQFVDSVPIAGSRRVIYVYIGAGLMAAGMILLAGAAGGWITFASREAIYVIASLGTMIGVVLQDVVADAMSTEVVERRDEAGRPLPEAQIRAELGMVQVLGRLALSFGIFAVAGLSGYLASVLPYEQVFLIGLIVPAISVTGVTLVRLETSERLPVDWRILGGGLAFGAVTVALGVFSIPFAQEIVFAISMTVIISLLVLITRDLDDETRRSILFATIVIFVFRATPLTGEGTRWFQIDVLGFDEGFFGVLDQIASTLGIVGMWLLSATVSRREIAWTLLWLTVIYTVLSLPSLGLYYGLHRWTEANFGFGAQTIAIIDTAAASPFAQLAMIPLLTLIAIYAPPGRRATWFALMASLMNLALVAGQLQTKYLNQIFNIDRGQYSELGWLMITVLVIGFVVPVTAIMLFGRRIASATPAQAKATSPDAVPGAKPMTAQAAAGQQHTGAGPTRAAPGPARGAGS
jgi:MFS family permease